MDLVLGYFAISSLVGLGFCFLISSLIIPFKNKADSSSKEHDMLKLFSFELCVMLFLIFSFINIYLIYKVEFFEKENNYKIHLSSIYKDESCVPNNNFQCIVGDNELKGYDDLIHISIPANSRIREKVEVSNILDDVLNEDLTVNVNNYYDIITLETEEHISVGGLFLTFFDEFPSYDSLNALYTVEGGYIDNTDILDISGTLSVDIQAEGNSTKTVLNVGDYKLIIDSKDTDLDVTELSSLTSFNGRNINLKIAVPSDYYKSKELPRFKLVSVEDIKEG